MLAQHQSERPELADWCRSSKVRFPFARSNPDRNLPDSMKQRANRNDGFIFKNVILCIKPEQ